MEGGRCIYQPASPFDETELIGDLRGGHKTCSLASWVRRQGGCALEGRARSRDRATHGGQAAVLFERGSDALVRPLGCHGAVPEPALRIGDGVGESPVHLKNFLGGGRLTDGRADQRVSEVHPAVGDLDQVRINSRLEGFKALSTGSRDLVQRRTAVERRREEDGASV